MKQYIDKDKVIEELKKRIEKYKILHSNSQLNLSKIALKENIVEYNNFLSFLDTLEVKEADLELNSFDATVCKNGNTYLKEMDRNAIAKALESYKDGDKVKVIIKAQK